jgi:hypothetical protein
LQGFADHLPAAHDHAANWIFPGFRFAFAGIARLIQ